MTSFFAGYSALNSGDAETMAYAADLEGRAIYQFEYIRVDPKLTVANACSMSDEEFCSTIKCAVRSIHGVPFSCDEQTPTNVGSNSGWSLFNDAKSAGEFWTSRLYYQVPAITSDQWKQPILVVNDGMGVQYSTGILPPRYPGENVAQILLNAGHPVLVMALKGMDDKYFTGGWGINGLDQFETFLKARCDTAVSVWIRDAYEAASLLMQWFPDQQIGITGVSKSAIVAASVALLQDAVNKVYLPSGFSAFESAFYSVTPWSYGLGERSKYERNAVVLALCDKDVRLSYSTNDDISYRIEAVEGRVLNAINTQRQLWNKPQISQFSSAPSHYYDAADVAAFFKDGACN